MGSAVYGPVFHGGTGRVRPQIIITFPIFGWSNWARTKTTTAIGTNVAEYVLNARITEGAFISANPGFERAGRQRFITVFAYWSKFKHDLSSV